MDGQRWDVHNPAPSASADGGLDGDEGGSRTGRDAPDVLRPVHPDMDEGRPSGQPDGDVQDMPDLSEVLGRKERLTDVPPQPVQPAAPALPLPSPAAAPVGAGDALFAQGYLDHGGDPALLDHLLVNVLPCEGGPTFRNDYGNGYISRAQFHPGSWATAARYTGLSDGANPYHVGANVAVWIRLIGGGSAAGTTSGWPVCWWRGLR
jgi:hypothetical protein